MAEPEYLPQIAFPADYPPAVISALPNRPPLPHRVVFPTGVSASGSVFLERGTFTLDGRSAFAQVAERLGLGAGDRVLLPAYHCRSMVEPFVWLGCEVDFFHLDPLLRPDAADLARRLGEPTRLVVVADYFGFTQIDVGTMDLLASAGVAVLRDCAHRLFLPEVASGITAAVTSLPKMLPLPRGGAWVWGADDTGSVRSDGVNGSIGTDTGGRVLDEVRVAARWLQAWARRPFHQAASPRLPDRDAVAATTTVATERPTASDLVPDGDRARGPGGFLYFRPAHFRERLTATEVRLARAADLTEIARRRRANYAALARAATDNPRLTLLYPLDETTVPYVVPVRLLEPKPQFDVLRRAGIAIQRWEDSAHTDCPTAGAYRESLVQLPCHQDLTHAQLSAMCDLLGHI